jgi:tetratricopeptide (TPR) repeat protein
MKHARLPKIFALATLACAVAAPALAQHEMGHDPSYPAGFDEPMPLAPAGLGPLSRPVTTTSPEAQAYFDQGLQLLYAFTPPDAARSFREAQKRDADCAMCYFGEAWAWGPYLNGAMREADAPRAYAAIQKALELAPQHASPVEQAMIEAMAVRYEPAHDADRRRALDEAYAEAIGEVYRRYPNDLDVGTLYGEALMLLEPRRGTWDIAKPEVQHIHQVLEEVLALDITHPGACHLYVHATEPTVEPGKAEACADFLGNSIPGASHINHMPSHTYNRIGRWCDAVRANIQAWHSDLKSEIGEGFAIYPSHNLHMLLFAASMDGQGGVATQAGKDYGKLMDDGQFYHALTLLRFGRFDEIIAMQDNAPNAPLLRGIWDFAVGYAHLRTGDVAAARTHLAAVRSAADGAAADTNFRGHPADQLLGTVGGILEGEILREEGDLAGAISAQETAVSWEDQLRYDEPEPLNFTARHWLGATLLEAGRATEAEAVYRASLVDHPNNGWSLLGLEQALRAQARDVEADEVHAQFEGAWARADHWIQTSRYQ